MIQAQWDNQERDAQVLAEYTAQTQKRRQYRWRRGLGIALSLALMFLAFFAAGYILLQWQKSEVPVTGALIFAWCGTYLLTTVGAIFKRRMWGEYLFVPNEVAEYPSPTELQAETEEFEAKKALWQSCRTGKDIMPPVDYTKVMQLADQLTPGRQVGDILFNLDTETTVIFVSQSTIDALSPDAKIDEGSIIFEEESK